MLKEHIQTHFYFVIKNIIISLKIIHFFSKFLYEIQNDLLIV